jgi:uroporphyrinogen-III synthase
MQNPATDRLREVKSILVSQPQAAQHAAHYTALEEKYNIKIDFRPFIHVEGVDAKEFRKQHISLQDFTAVIMTSKYAVDNYFRLCEECRVKISEDTKYFCVTEQIALYLQRYITYRKRKVFFGERSLEDLKNALTKHKKTEKFLLPCSNIGSRGEKTFLTEKGIPFTESLMYKTVSSDLSDLKDIFYDMLVFFSPQGLESLFENFPDFKQNNTRIATFGQATQTAATSKGLIVDLPAPTTEFPSMTMAIEHYIKQVNPPRVVS